MSIEGLGKRFKQAREKRGFTLDEAARMTKIRPSRLAEIEADDYSQFPSLAYAKGFLLIYGKFLEVDVSEYMEAFETSSQMTVDGYSYLQEGSPAKPHREHSPVIRHRPMKSERSSPWPLLIGVGVIIAGFLLMRLVMNLQRIGPRPEQRIGVAETTPAPAPPAPSVAPTAAVVQSTPVVAVPKSSPPPPTAPPVASATAAPQIASSSPVAAPPPPAVGPSKEPEIRRAEPVKPEDLARAGATAETQTSPAAAAATPAESVGANKIAIRPLRKTYIKVVVDNDLVNPPFERWISPADGVVEFHGQHIAVRVLDRDAIQIKKNGKSLTDGDNDVTVE